jgi:hypothetical protein
MRTARSSRRRILAAFTATIVSTVCFAQEYRGRIQGTVTDLTCHDPSGRP